MANRSYLYSINELPGEKPTQNLTVKGLSEFNWGTPLVYLILISGKPIICESLIREYKEKICIAGEFDQGVTNLKHFGQLMIDSNVAHKEQFEAKLSEAIEFLSKPENRQPYIFLELAEMYDMSEYNSALDFQIKAEDALRAIQNKDIDTLQSLHELDESNILLNWEEIIGIDYWSDVLYFDFPKPFEFKTKFPPQPPAQVATGNLSALAQALKKIQ